MPDESQKRFRNEVNMFKTLVKVAGRTTLWSLATLGAAGVAGYFLEKKEANEQKAEDQEPLKVVNA